MNPSERSEIMELARRRHNRRNSQIVSAIIALTFSAAILAYATAWLLTSIWMVIR